MISRYGHDTESSADSTKQHRNGTDGAAAVIASGRSAAATSASAPPWLPPVTPIRDASTSGRPWIVSTARATSTYSPRYEYVSRSVMLWVSRPGKPGLNTSFEPSLPRVEIANAA